MSLEDRLRQYANPRSRANWQGASRDKANLTRWSERAAENSKIAPRARSGSSATSTARADLNHVGGWFMPSVRRET